jgi:hypothetical protein
MVAVKFNRARLNSTGAANEVLDVTGKNEDQNGNEFNHLIDFFRKNQLTSALASR